jgi:hypothetical protein
MRSLVALTLALAFTPGFSAASSLTEFVGDEIEESAFVKVKIEEAGKTIDHPGFRVTDGETALFDIEEGGRKHRVEVVLTLKGDRHTSSVTYSRGGTRKVAGDLAGPTGQWTTIASADGKIKVSLFVDPTGQSDETRRDKIEGPGGDDPLDGLKKKKKPSAG